MASRPELLLLQEAAAATIGEQHSEGSGTAVRLPREALPSTENLEDCSRSVSGQRLLPGLSAKLTGSLILLPAGPCSPSPHSSEGTQHQCHPAGRAPQHSTAQPEVVGSRAPVSRGCPGPEDRLRG